MRFFCPDNHSSLDALIEALEELDKVCETVEEAYTASLKQGKFERWEEKY
jgi:DNA-directed RNA polymerase I and III subunit RPAC2